MARDIITKHEGTAYQGRRGSEERRDVFTAELDYGASIVDDGPPNEPPVIAEPVYTIMGSGESRREGWYGDKRDDEWTWGTGTNLRVSRSSIPALMRVLADLMEHEPTV